MLPGHIEQFRKGHEKQMRPKFIHSVTFCLSSLLLFSNTVAAQMPGRFPEKEAQPGNTLGDRSDAEIWRALREGAEGLPAGSRPKPEDGVLINADGEWWTQVHVDQVINYGAMALLAVLFAISLYFAFRGRIKIANGRSGQAVSRFTLFQRVIHWFMVSLFLLMALTGLILLFGRTAFAPIIGREAFSIMASASMQMHNLFGPLFILALAALFIGFVRGNLPSLSDVWWLLKGGGMFGSHASAGRYNLGEKVWFWSVIFGGLALSVSGIMLLFPDALGTRDQIQFANLVHAFAALGLTGFAFGHIYLGTAGTEGTLEGMVHGDVDKNWALTHHDQWLESAQTDPGKIRP